jgi:hypothetical protein
MTWLDERLPPIPKEFRGRLRRESGEGGTTDGLTRAAIEDLRVALARPGRDRGAAFYLLASDAYASYACEAAAQAETVEPVLLQILEAVQVTED